MVETVVVVVVVVETEVGVVVKTMVVVKTVVVLETVVKVMVVVAFRLFCGRETVTVTGKYSSLVTLNFTPRTNMNNY